MGRILQETLAEDGFLHLKIEAPASRVDALKTYAAGADRLAAE
jgi:hypothetical protein